MNDNKEIDISGVKINTIANKVLIVYNFIYNIN